MPQDILITNARLVDGSGTAAYEADVLVSGRYVASVEPAGRMSPAGRTVLDAGGAVVCPGFVDVHSHADNAPLLDEDDTSKILQGVTTEVVGNCGFSLAPRVGDGGELDEVMSRLFPPISWSWSTFRDLFDVTDARGYVTNYAPLAGHHALRVATMGMAARAPSGAELATMGRLLDEAVEAGVFGLSSGLIYPPGAFASREELAELVRRLPEGAVYATHMRNEGTELEASVDEALWVGRTAGRKVQISHLKAAGRSNWGKLPAALEQLERARGEGIDVLHDVYPYAAASTTLASLVPPRWHEGGDEALIARLSAPHAAEDLAAELGRDDGSWENFVNGSDWEHIYLSSTASHRLEGTTIGERAAIVGTRPEQVLVDILLGERLQATMTLPLMSEEDVAASVSGHDAMIGSDGLPPGLGGLPHPRTGGTFPRYIGRFTGGPGQPSLEEAVRRITDLPSRRFGIAGRGRVSEGYMADLVAFDPETFRDRAVLGDPFAPASGLSWVMQAGEVVVSDGRYSGRRNGSRLVPARGA